MPKWWPAKDEVFGYKLSPELVEAISDMLEATRADGLEHGIAVCVPRGSKTAYPGQTKCVGDECSVYVEDCDDPNLQVGIIHTHPNGNPEPSLGDAVSAAYRKRDLRPYGIQRSLNCNVTIRPGEARGLMTCLDVSPHNDPADVLKNAAAVSRKNPLGGHGRLMADWELSSKYDFAETKLYSEETREAIRRDPTVYVNTHPGGREDVVNLLEPNEVEQTMRQVIVDRLNEAVAELDEFREAVPKEYLKEMASLLMSGLGAEMHEFEALGRALCDKANIHMHADSLYLLGKMEGALNEAELEDEVRRRAETALSRARRNITSAIYDQTETCYCRPGKMEGA